MKHALNPSDDATKRAAYIAGHINGIHKMLQDGRYCIDVIKQIDAVEGSLIKLKETILENHLNHCVVDTIKNGSPRQRSSAINELLEVYKTQSK